MKYAKRTQRYVNFDTARDAAIAGADKHQFDLIQYKHDGWWACAYIKRGRALIYTRQGLLRERLEAPKAIDAIVIGEWIGGTQRAVKSASADRLVVFDCVRSYGEAIDNCDYDARMAAISGAVAQCDWMQMVVSNPIGEYAGIWRSIVGPKCPSTVEGAVFRSSRHAYADAVIGRVKRQYTLDYVVMRVEVGQGKHAGRMGALVCGLYEGRRLVEKVRVGGGWSDRERDVIWAQPKHFIGRVLEVKGWQVFESGSMRHPNAVRWRDDKSPRECVFTPSNVEVIR